MQERNSFYTVQSPAYFSQDFRAYLQYEVNQYRFNETRLCLWHISDYNKPRKAQAVSLPKLAHVQRLAQNGYPIISIVGRETLSYLD